MIDKAVIDPLLGKFEDFGASALRLDRTPNYAFGPAISWN
jgi:hypothetical protein